MTAATYRPDHDTEREPFREVSRHEPCEACGSDHWCMATASTAMCMRVSEGSYRTKENSQGEEYYLHRRTGAAPPTPIRLARREERPDWARPDPLAYRAMLAELERRCTPTPPPGAVGAAEADRRRFGAHAAGVAAIADAGYLADPRGFRRWLRDEGRDPQARACGFLTGADDLAAFLLRKLYFWRDVDGQVCDVRGRDWTGQAARKVLAPAGNREEKGCAGAFYQAPQIRIAAAQGGHLYAAGGHEKADALISAGLPTIGLNEGQLSDAMRDGLRAAGIELLTFVADGEPPKARPDGTLAPLSEGQRLVIRTAQRVEEVAICARVAEPAREPDGPKVDADSLLRDHGPEALRALVREAVPLAVYRRRVGAEAEAAPPRLVEELRGQLADRDRLLADRDRLLAHAHEDGARKDARNAALVAEVEALEACIAHANQTVGAALPDIAEALVASYQRGDTLMQGGREYARCVNKQAAKRRSPTTVGRAMKAIAAERPADIITRTETIETERFKGPVEITNVCVPPEHRQSRAAVMLYLMPPPPAKKRHGGDHRITVPPEVAAQDAPVRRERREVQRFYSLVDERPLGAIEAPRPTVDFWTADGAPLTAAEAEAFRVKAGAQPPPPPRYRPPQSRVQDARKVSSTPSVQDASGPPVVGVAAPPPPPVQDARGPEPAPFVNRGCRIATCGAPPTRGGYCDRHHPDAWGDALDLRERAPTPLHPRQGRPRCMNRACHQPMPEGDTALYCPTCRRDGWGSAPAAAGD